MVNENGANYCAINQVSGVNFIISKVVRCQMHYKNEINRVSFRSGPSYRDLFKSICYGMCFIATMAEYNEQKQWLDKVANIFPFLFLDESHGGISGSITCLLVSDALALLVSHWPKAMMQCSSTAHNYGCWKLHEMTYLQCSHKLINFIHS